jgi:hypothetical protein
MGLSPDPWYPKKNRILAKGKNRKKKQKAASGKQGGPFPGGSGGEVLPGTADVFMLQFIKWFGITIGHFLRDHQFFEVERNEKCGDQDPRCR